MSEYGFPTDAIRRIEEKHDDLTRMEVQDAKDYCRKHYREISLLLDQYENKLFITAMRNI